MFDFRQNLLTKSKDLTKGLIIAFATDGRPYGDETRVHSSDVYNTKCDKPKIRRAFLAIAGRRRLFSKRDAGR